VQVEVRPTLQLPSKGGSKGRAGRGQRSEMYHCNTLTGNVYLDVELEMGEMYYARLEIDVELRQIELLLQEVPKRLVQEELVQVQTKGGGQYRSRRDLISIY
jgi:hypothetical protein